MRHKRSCGLDAADRLLASRLSSEERPDLPECWCSDSGTCWGKRAIDSDTEPSRNGAALLFFVCLWLHSAIYVVWESASC
mmetsp:Transcript_4515/g.12516  ORF Transcript_4515/g.12516 Transcript_4515/m.12516 type:complete len:80 (+) Transcript_4515:1674-1913(+)